VPAEDTSGGRGVEGWSETRTGVVRDAVGIGLATGAYALSFGAISSAAGLSVLQTSALSLLMFTGASQFALVGVVGAGGGPLAGAATAVLLGSRNALYGLRLSTLLGVAGLRRIAASHLVIDESTAMAIGRPSARAARLAFWATGLSVFVGWNTGTLVGAVGVRALASPRTLGLDAAVPAAFLALVAPRLRSTESRMVALAAAGVALLAVPFAPTGTAVLLAALVAAGVGLGPAGADEAPGAGTREDG
jgi:predicted branched-subunit amino acid permease